MVLFANANFRPSEILTSSRGLPELPRRIPGLGYILFPAPEPQQPFSPASRTAHETRVLTPEAELKQDRDQAGTEKEHNTTENDLDQQAQRRRALEAAEASKGEEDWVRSGGVLRDKEGRRDWSRTQAIREELRLREVEAQIAERWNEYEEGWSKILSWTRQESKSTAKTYLGFQDIPWPVRTVKGVKPKVEDLTVEQIKEFLLEGLSIRGVKVTKKDRIRSSLLRWHPDKLGNLLQQIRPEDIGDVRQGLGIVMECLQILNAQS